MIPTVIHLSFPKRLPPWPKLFTSYHIHHFPSCQYSLAGPSHQIVPGSALILSANTTWPAVGGIYPGEKSLLRPFAPLWKGQSSLGIMSFKPRALQFCGDRNLATTLLKLFRDVLGSPSDTTVKAVVFQTMRQPKKPRVFSEHQVKLTAMANRATFRGHLLLNEIASLKIVLSCEEGPKLFSSIQKKLKTPKHAAKSRFTSGSAWNLGHSATLDPIFHSFYMISVLEMWFFGLWGDALTWSLFKTEGDHEETEFHIAFIGRFFWRWEAHVESVRVILDIHHFGFLVVNDEPTLGGYLLDVECRARWVAIYWYSTIDM